MLGFTFSILMLASYPSTEKFDDGRIKVSAVIRNISSPRDNARAQILLMRMAKKACKKGTIAVSEGSLHLDKLIPEGKKREVFVISESYRCVPKAD